MIRQILLFQKKLPTLCHLIQKLIYFFNNEDGTLLPGSKIAITEDCLVDDRGFTYVDTFQDGLYIVKLKMEDSY